MSATCHGSLPCHGSFDSRYLLYADALRIFIREGQTLQQLQASLCWARLMTMHQSFPWLYSDPAQLYINLKHETST